MIQQFYEEAKKTYASHQSKQMPSRVTAKAMRYHARAIENLVRDVLALPQIIAETQLVLLSQPPDTMR